MKAFEGVRILDFTTFLAGPYLCRLLADLGADVIKVESEMPEAYRMLSFAFATQNRNKKSISLDLKKVQGKTIIVELIKRANIIVENSRPGVMQKLGLDYGSCKKIKPDIIYISASGFGTRGPLASLPGLDPMMAGFSGQTMSTCGPSNPPIYPKVNVSDVGVSALGAFGAALALFACAKTGEGQKVDTSLLHAALASGTHVYFDFPGIKRSYIDEKYPKGKSATSRLYCGIDGKWFFINCNTEADWQNLCKSTYLNNLISDPRFATPQARLKNDQALAQILSDFFALSYADDWVFLLSSNKIPAVPALYEQDLYNNVHFTENNVFIEQFHPDLGHAQLVGFPAEFHNMENVLDRRAPLLGENAGEILSELGYTQEQIEKLKKDKVVFW